MENKLYYSNYTREVTLLNGNILKYKNYSNNISYGMPMEEIKMLNDWDDFLLNGMGYVPEFKGYTNRKGKVWCNVEYHDKHDNWCRTKVYKDEFVSANIYSENKIIDQKNIRMKRLVDELSADEFVLFLKDNGIGELQIT